MIKSVPDPVGKDVLVFVKTKDGFNAAAGLITCECIGYENGWLELKSSLTKSGIIFKALRDHCVIIMN